MTIIYRCPSPGYRIVDVGIKSVATPALTIPQVVNFLAGGLFAYSLRFCRISIAGPLANGNECVFVEKGVLQGCLAYFREYYNTVANEIVSPAGVSLATTAIVALWLGERHTDVQRTVFGLAFVTLGASLCARSSS